LAISLALDLKEGEVAKVPIKVGVSYLIFAATKRTEPDLTKLATERDSIRQRLLGDRQGQVYDAYLRAARPRASASRPSSCSADWPRPPCSCWASRSSTRPRCRPRSSASRATPLGLAPTDVRCPSDVPLKAGNVFTSTAQLDGQQVTFTVRQNDDQGNVHIQSSGLVVVDKIEKTPAERATRTPA
jgi:hypothetical protein